MIEQILRDDFQNLVGLEEYACGRILSSIIHNNDERRK
jgi:hypothetical protein